MVNVFRLFASKDCVVDFYPFFEIVQLKEEICVLLSVVPYFDGLVYILILKYFFFYIIISALELKKSFLSMLSCIQSVNTASGHTVGLLFE